MIFDSSEALANFVNLPRDFGELLLACLRMAAGGGVFKPAQSRFDPIGDLANLPAAVLLHLSERRRKPFGKKLVDDGTDLVGNFLAKGRCALHRGDFAKEKLCEFLLQLGNVVG